MAGEHGTEVMATKSRQMLALIVVAAVPAPAADGLYF
jgi:hypothetical protein